MNRLILVFALIIGFSNAVPAFAHNHVEPEGATAVTTNKSKAMCDDKKGCKLCPEHATAATGEHADHADHSAHTANKCADATSCADTKSSDALSNLTATTASKASCGMSCCNKDGTCKTACKCSSCASKSSAPKAKAGS